MNAPIPNRYDAQNAKALVQCAAEAYGDGGATLRPSSEVLRRADGAVTNQGSIHPPYDCGGRAESYPTVIEDSDTDTRAVIYHGERDTVIAFRGTADARNWLTDLDARLMTENGPSFHPP